MGHPFHLRYSSPADCWNDSIPLGNGKIGAMVYGHTGVERIQLNDDSLWSGTLMDRNNPSLKEKLPEIQRLVLAGDIFHAEEMILQHMAGTPGCMRHYSPLGTLNLALNRHLPFAIGWLPDSSESASYTSDLDLMTGVLNISHRQEGIVYNREMFISHPDNVLCLRLVSSVPRAINLDIMLNRIPISDAVTNDDRRPGRRVSGGGWGAINADSIRTIDDRTILMRGHESEVAFSAGARVVCDGELLNPVSQLLARNCSEVLIYFTSDTSNRTNDSVNSVLSRLSAAHAKSYDSLKAAHIADFSRLMNRCVLELGEQTDESTDERLRKIATGHKDPALAALYFQFGRYLMVSGGREDSAALNLQGIWNADFMPMWDSKYTININLQMNYWVAEVCNLSELHLPLMDLLKKMHIQGQLTAHNMYGMRGMVCHHNTDYYGDCAPQDWYMAAMPWVTGSAWLALHVWEHFLHTHDKVFLREMYPIIKDMALFYEDFLIEVEGQLVTCPSISPENRYLLSNGYDTPVCTAPAMDSQILREFFTACINASRILVADFQLAKTWENIISKLPRDKVGSQGQLLEWQQEYPELTPGMGHVSHLFACYPGNSINWRDTPELMQAVRKTLEIRMENGAGKNHWPLAWFINLFARLMDGEQTDQGIQRMLADSTTRSMLNATFVFQIDGNFGAAAGIAESLLQSHLGLHFLPALPASWTDGKVSGLCARGGHEVDLIWKNRQLKEAFVRTRFDGPVEIVGNQMMIFDGDTRISTEKTAVGFIFDAKAGGAYKLVPDEGL